MKNFLILYLCSSALLYSQNPNFDQGVIIIASNNKKMHAKICLRIKEIIKKNNIYPFIP